MNNSELSKTVKEVPTPNGYRTVELRIFQMEQIAGNSCVKVRGHHEYYSGRERGWLRRDDLNGQSAGLEVRYVPCHLKDVSVKGFSPEAVKAVRLFKSGNYDLFKFYNICIANNKRFEDEFGILQSKGLINILEED